MILRARRTAPRIPARTGAAAVETALIMIPLIMVFFGIFEYGRFLMDLNVLNNAAREGCRYALVHNTDSTISADVTSIVKTRLGARLSNFSSLTVTVSGTHSGVSTTVTDLGAGDLITVSISGTYSFLNIIPLVKMPTSFSVSSSVTMVCEGAT